jgi:hypothetical protein
MKTLSQKADTLAIPFFILSAVYFIRIKNKTSVEKILLGFSIGGLVADIYFATRV